MEWSRTSTLDRPLTMATTDRTVSFLVVKNFLLLLTLLMLFGSLWVGYASWRTYRKLELSVANDPYRLQYQEIHIWRFITVVTLCLQDATGVFVGVIGAYKESYELTLSYTIITATVFVLNLVIPALRNTIVGPVFSAAVAVIAFLFTRCLRRTAYEIGDKKNRSKV